MSANSQPDTHCLDAAFIDGLDEVDEDRQHCLVWCETHQEFEWHWLDVERDIGRKIVRRSEPLR